jgi:uncharacterized protein (DUF302 family)
MLRPTSSLPGDAKMRARTTVVSAVLAGALLSSFLVAQSSADRVEPTSAEGGVVRVRSGYPQAATVDRLKQDVAAKGIMMFSVIDQGKLAKDAGIDLGPSVLLVFGNPALGAQFITSKPQAGLDWPVRLLVQEDASGQVWVTYTDFAWIARRHRITDREQAFSMATKVIGSITSTVAKH